MDRVIKRPSKYSLRQGPTAATLARDEALRQVEANAGVSFNDAVRDIVLGQEGRTATGEDIRLICESEGIAPHHHNAWGAAINTLVRNGVLEHTGEYRSMETERSHARRTPVYYIGGNNGSR